MSELRLLVDDIRANYGRKLVALLMLMVVVALSEGMSIALLLPLLSAIGIGGVVKDGIVQHSIALFLKATSLSGSVYSLAALIILVSLAQMTLYICQSWWVAALQREYAAKWQKRLFEAFMYARWGFFINKKMGVLVNAITSETGRLAGAFFIIAQLAATAIVSIVYLLIALSVSWQVTVSLFLLAGLLFASIRCISQKNYKIGVRLGPLSAELNVLSSEFITGARLIKATATESIAVQHVSKIIDDLRVHHTWATFLPGLVRGIFEFASISALCVIFVFGHNQLKIAAANMLVVLALFVRILPRFNALQQNIQMLNTYVPAMQAVHDLLREAERETEQSRYAENNTFGDMQSTGEVCIRITEAGYRDAIVLRNIKIDLPKHGFIGIVGESGAGKSTLINCLLGLSEIRTGSIHVDGISISDMPLNHWRRQIGYVPQETILFHMTVRENIAWGHESATKEDILQAAEQAFADDFISVLPQGYDTIIGDQGVLLSGGQRQRLGVARALVGKPGILLLDEATSALDSTSEQAILETIETLRRDICVVSVAHRLATVSSADRIYVMHKGTIVESGNWEQLLGDRHVFYELAISQHVV